MLNVGREKARREENATRPDPIEAAVHLMGHLTPGAPPASLAHLGADTMRAWGSITDTFFDVLTHSLPPIRMIAQLSTR